MHKPMRPAYPEPLPEAPVDPRLPCDLKQIERDIYAKNHGFDTYDDYQSSRWRTPDPQPQRGSDDPVKAQSGSVETTNTVGHVAKR